MESEDPASGDETCGCAPAARLLIVPGLHDSPPDHWQSWLQAQFRDAVRVTQRDWAQPDLERWAGRIGAVLEHGGCGPWLAVAHSFGALALVRHLARVPGSPIAAALLVAPADPDRFGIGEALPQQGLGVHTTLVLSTSDPWLAPAQALRWARRWGSHTVNLGDAGHINLAAGFRTLPLARRWVLSTGQKLVRERREAQAATPLFA